MFVFCVVIVDEFEDGFVEFCRGIFCFVVEVILELILLGVVFVLLFLLLEFLFDVVLLLLVLCKFDMVLLLFLVLIVLLFVVLLGFVIFVCVDDLVCCGSGDLFVVLVVFCELFFLEGFVELFEFDYKFEFELERLLLLLLLFLRLSFVKFVVFGLLKIFLSKVLGVF